MNYETQNTTSRLSFSLSSGKGTTSTQQSKPVRRSVLVDPKEQDRLQLILDAAGCGR